MLDLGQHGDGKSDGAMCLHGVRCSLFVVRCSWFVVCCVLFAPFVKESRAFGSVSSKSARLVQHIRAFRPVDPRVSSIKKRAV